MKKFFNAFFTFLMLAVSLLLPTSCDEKISEPEVIAVTGVSLSKTSVILTEGDEIALTVTVNPDNATNKNVIWKSSDKSVAAVSDGKVIALKAGVATITVTTEDANKTDACQVTVVSKVIPVAEVSLDKTSIELIEGDEVTLVAKINPDNATNKNMIWNSSNNNVAIVSDGKVVALKAGTSTITVTTEDGNKTATCKVRVIAEAVPVAGIRLDKNSAEMYVGDQIMLTATVVPENATDKTVTWSSSNNSVATVNNGKITAVSVGNATITAQIGGIKSECSVTVNPIEVKSITLDCTSLTLEVGHTTLLFATVLPENATDKTIIWSSSDTNIVELFEWNNHEYVTAISVGEATVTARIGDIKAECVITVKPIEVTGITLNYESAVLSAGESILLNATIFPDDATDKTITWLSSDNSVAIVSDGKVTAMSVGEATITARIGNVKSECFIIVNPTEVASMTLDKSSVTLAPDESVTLNATVLPVNATDKTVIWSSSDNGVATVTNGIVTAISVGKATITAKTSNERYATCLVDVINKPQAGGSEGTGEIEW